MTYPRCILLLTLTVSNTLASAATPLDVPSLVRAIVVIEGSPWGKLGGAGNMTRGTWKDRTSLPYELSKNPRYALPVYEAHVHWIVRQLQNNGQQPTPAAIYDCWWLGVTGAIERVRRTETAHRCENLYRVFSRENSR